MTLGLVKVPLFLPQYPQLLQDGGLGPGSCVLSSGKYSMHDIANEYLERVMLDEYPRAEIYY